MGSYLWKWYLLKRYVSKHPSERSVGVTVFVSDEPKYLSAEEVVQALKENDKQLADVPLTYQSVNIWWPQDRAWCVHTEIDLDTTYLAGSQALVDALCQVPELEVWQMQPTDPVSYAGDTINSLPKR